MYGGVKNRRALIRGYESFPTTRNPLFNTFLLENHYRILFRIECRMRITFVSTSVQTNEFVGIAVDSGGPENSVECGVWCVVWHLCPRECPTRGAYSPLP